MSRGCHPFYEVLTQTLEIYFPMNINESGKMYHKIAILLYFAKKKGRKSHGIKKNVSENTKFSFRARVDIKL